MDQINRNKALVQDWFAAFPNLTNEVFERFIHPDFINYPAPESLRSGRENFKKVMRYVLSAAPEQRYECEKLIAEGDLVTTLTRWKGTFEGEFLGVRGNGRPFDVGQSHTFRIADDKLIEHWAVRDDLGIFRQTNVKPPA